MCSFERVRSASVLLTDLWKRMLYGVPFKCIFVLIDDILHMAHQYFLDITQL